MDFVDRIKQYENAHIFFWLVKDSCWMLELKWAGTLVMIPTLYVAALIVYKTRRTHEIYINLAILSWIVANSYWMMIEFFNNNIFKNFAALPFGLGFVFVFIYYFKRHQKKPQAS